MFDYVAVEWNEMSASFNRNTAWYIKLCKRVNSRPLAFLHKWEKMFRLQHSIMMWSSCLFNVIDRHLSDKQDIAPFAREKKMWFSDVFLSVFLALHFICSTVCNMTNIFTCAYSFFITFFFSLYNAATASVGSLSLVQIKYGINYY